MPDAPPITPAPTTAGQALLHAIADRLLLAELSRRPIAPISDQHPELTVADAYTIQTINVHSRQVDARAPVRVVGHKVGLTSKAMQEMLGVDDPDYGVLYADRVHRSGATLDVDALIAPKIEPEVAFVLGEDLAGDAVDAARVLAATAYVVPAIELIDSRIAGWRIKLVDTVADNASGAGVVLGTQRTRPADVALDEAAVEMTGGTVTEDGTGAAVLGHPAEAVAWLARTLAGYGRTLPAGSLVLPGAMTRALDARAGETATADFGALGTVEVTFR